MNYPVLRALRNVLMVGILLYLTCLTLTAKSPYYYLSVKSVDGVEITHAMISKMNGVELKRFHWLIVLGLSKIPLALLAGGLAGDALTFLVREQEKYRVLIFTTSCYAVALWMFYPAIPMLPHILAT